jgi:hypothetical protein
MSKSSSDATLIRAVDGYDRTNKKVLETLDNATELTQDSMVQLLQRVMGAYRFFSFSKKKHNLSGAPYMLTRPMFSLQVVGSKHLRTRRASTVKSRAKWVGTLLWPRN